MSSSLQLWRRLPQLSRAICYQRRMLVRHLASISAGPLLSVYPSEDWGGSSSHGHRAPFLPSVGMITTFGLGLLLCSSNRRGFQKVKYAATKVEWEKAWGQARPFPHSVLINCKQSELELGKAQEQGKARKSPGNEANRREDERRFIVAAKEGDLPILRQLLDNGVDINCRHPLGWTALHTAVVNSNWSVVRLLVESGADVNVKDEFSSADRVAFRERVSRLSVASVRDREFSSKINHYVSYSGFTPLHYAVVMEEEGREEMVRYLLDHGADPTIENNRGFCPIKYCTNEETRKMLQEYASEVEEQRLQEHLEERRKFPLEDHLRQHIVGQEGPITTTAAAIRRWEIGWADDDHPLVFLFLGSSGIGKTELAKQIANYIHKDDKKGFIRLDMSEYQEKHEVAKLIGAPPGYVGYDQGGQLTSRLRECPTAVVLFDEVDKAHPDVLTALLQLFDEGRLTDGQGRTTECKEAIFVMTSNLANNEIAQHALQLRREAQRATETYRKNERDTKEQIEISKEFKEEVVEPILKHHFRRDEFLGRINEMVYFLPFSRSELNQLVEKELTVWQERAKSRHSIRLTWDREVLDVLADGYNVKYGARSIQHEVERHVVNQLAAAYEQQVISRGSLVHLVVEGRGIRLDVTKGSQHKRGGIQRTAATF